MSDDFSETSEIVGELCQAAYAPVATTLERLGCLSSDKQVLGALLVVFVSLLCDVVEKRLERDEDPAELTGPLVDEAVNVMLGRLGYKLVPLVRH